MMIKKLVSAIAIMLVLVLSACSSQTTSNNNPAPAFNLKDIEGITHSLSEYKGKKIYVKFWASWCPICLSGLEEINTLASEENDFVVLTVVSPGYNNEKNTESFIKWFKGVDGVSNLTVLLDEEGTIAKQFNVRGYPTSAFISSDGSLIKTQPGHLNNEQIKEQIKNIP